MSWTKPPPRVKQYDGPDPTPRACVMRIADQQARLVVPLPKEAPLRSEDYRRFVASHPCFDCGIAGFSQCAHENLGKGMALKTDDRRSFPLCGARYGLLGCHQEFDLGLGLSRDERRIQGAAWADRMQELAHAAGRKEFA